jgi:hypothetical protein
MRLPINTDDICMVLWTHKGLNVLLFHCKRPSGRTRVVRVARRPHGVHGGLTGRTAASRGTRRPHGALGGLTGHSAALRCRTAA